MSERPGEHPQATGARLLEHLDEKGGSGAIDAFGRILAERIRAGVEPEGFALAVEEVHADIEAGMDGLTNEPLPTVLSELSPLMRGVLRRGVERATAQVFGDEFAHAVSEIYNERLPQLMEAQGARGPEA